MSFKVKPILQIALVLIFSSHSSAIAEQCQYLEKNDLSFPVEPESQFADGKTKSKAKNEAKGVSKEQYESLLKRAEEIYRPIFSARGAQLNVLRRWSSKSFNAGATRRGSEWIVMVSGGMARHPSVTPDGLAQVLCHEIGHHIGGAPKVVIRNREESSEEKKLIKPYVLNDQLNWAGQNGWASNEGQSDYFSTLKCMRRLFAGDDNSKYLADQNVPSKLKSECEKSYQSAANQGLCVRMGMAGLVMSKILAKFQKAPEPKFSTPSAKQVSSTSDRHPRAQCRLDTMFRGAICTAKLSDQVSSSDPNVGVCSRKFGDERGGRPFCWYKP